ncbi:hypothetical protein GCM10027202_11800 [Microvirgula curvata]|uniref:MoxR-vWA-beta-propeller ternary system domain-containing protein n=1 Tax=Microvirgula aerodenitrificans TaxID=57480 RepID=A0A2S0PBT3_9NEIS|nr:hypothetical protein [Microvirgula aerodenitrificans]AVY94848.1 hypothetical protein DAI18_12965 [Microvirgula aerodenitrificans]
MTLVPPLPWHWRPAVTVAEPAAAVAGRDAAPALLARLASLPANVRARLQMCSSSDLLVLIGAAADLPWVDGIAYAAPSRQAPALWLPTQDEPDVAHDLLARALDLRCHRQPLLLWRTPAVFMPLDRQHAVSPCLLERLARRWPGHP